MTTTDTTASNHGGYYPGTLPSTGFSFDSSSTAGAEAASASYGPVYTYVVPTGGYAPNGNLLAHSDSVMGDWAFQYDTLNRLTVAAPADNAPSSFVSRLGCFAYDGFGNRTLEVYTITADCSSAIATRATYNTQNQVTYVSQTAPVAYSAPSGFTYDLAGNVIADGQNQLVAQKHSPSLCLLRISRGFPHPTKHSSLRNIES